MEIAPIVSLYVDMLHIALPVAFVFWAGQLIVTSFLSAVFGGRLTFRICFLPLSPESPILTFSGVAEGRNRNVDICSRKYHFGLNWYALCL